MRDGSEFSNRLDAHVPPPRGESNMTRHFSSFSSPIDLLRSEPAESPAALASIVCYGNYEWWSALPSPVLRLVLIFGTTLAAFFLFFGMNSHVFCLFVRARSTLLKSLAPCSSSLSSRDIYRARIFLEYTLLFSSLPTDTFFNLQQSQRLRLDSASLHQELPSHLHFASILHLHKSGHK